MEERKYKKHNESTEEKKKSRQKLGDKIASGLWRAGGRRTSLHLTSELFIAIQAPRNCRPAPNTEGPRGSWIYASIPAAADLSRSAR